MDNNDKVEKELNKNEKPIIGWRYIIQYEKKNNNDKDKSIWFKCNLCKSSTTKNVINLLSLNSHLSGQEHVYNYIKKHHRGEYEEIQKNNPDTKLIWVEIVKLVEKITKGEYKKIYNIQDVTILIEDKPKDTKYLEELIKVNNLAVLQASIPSFTKGVSFTFQWMKTDPEMKKYCSNEYKPYNIDISHIKSEPMTP